MDKRLQNISPRGSDPRLHPPFEELAAQQGIAPIEDFEALLGKPSPEDESTDEFSASLRQWRREGTRSDSPQ